MYVFRKKQESRDGSRASTSNNGRGRPLKDNRIPILGKHICRFSSACHKNNIAVRKVIQYNEKFSEDIKILTAFAEKHRKTISSCRLMIGLKVRLPIDNKTRWLFLFTMLLCFKKAYERGKHVSRW